MRAGEAPHHPGTETVWQWLDEVMDPEIPVLSVLDLGIVRDVRWDGAALQIDVTPTYNGCPATRFIAESIVEALQAHGIAHVSVNTVLSPPWSTDRISERGRERLHAYGIAPPQAAQGAGGWRRGKPALACPRCGASDVERLSEFGSTPCKAQYRCRGCLEPFEYFKCI